MQFSRLQIFNLVGLIIVAFLAFEFFKFASNPVPVDLEHNLKLEVDNLNEKEVGSIFLGSLRLDKSEVSGSTIVLKFREINKIYGRKFEFDSLRGIFCVAILNGLDSDAHRSSISIRLYSIAGEKYEELQIDPEKCKNFGYRPVTG